MVDALQDTLNVVRYIIVRDVQDCEASAGQNAVSLLIGNLLLQMDRPIHFDDERGSMAVEVHNEANDELLAAEVQPLKLIGLEALP